MTSMRIGPEHDSQRTRSRPSTISKNMRIGEQRTEKQRIQVPEQEATTGGDRWWSRVTRRTLELLLRSNSRSEHMFFYADHEMDQSASGSVKSMNEFGFVWCFVVFRRDVWPIALCTATNIGIHNIYTCLVWAIADTRWDIRVLVKRYAIKRFYTHRRILVIRPHRPSPLRQIPTPYKGIVK